MVQICKPCETCTFSLLISSLTCRNGRKMDMFYVCYMCSSRDIIFARFSDGNWRQLALFVHCLQLMKTLNAPTERMCQDKVQCMCAFTSQVKTVNSVMCCCGLQGIMHPWFDVSFRHYIYCLLVYILCFTTYSVFFTSSYILSLFWSGWKSWTFVGMTLSEMPTYIALPTSHHFHPSLSPVVSLWASCTNGWERIC